MPDDIEIVDNGLLWTGERFIPGIEGAIEMEHMHRYMCSIAFCRGKDVLDIACGEGYGSYILAGVAKSVIGVDIDEEVVEHARKMYQRPALSFVVGACQNIPVSSASFDVVVSFETLEHIVEHDEFISEIKRVLRHDGLLIISTPDKHIYSDIPNYKNPFHLKELYEPGFEQLLSKCFSQIKIVKQEVLSGSVITGKESSGKQLVSVYEYEKGNGEMQPLNRFAEATYMVAIASDYPIGEFEENVLIFPPKVGEHIFELNQMLQDLTRARNELEDNLQSLNVELSRHTAENLALQNEISQHIEKNLVLQTESLHRSITNQKFKFELSLRSRENRKLQSLLMQHSKEHSKLQAVLEQAIVEKQKLAFQLDEVFSSISWRLVAPIRFIEKRSVALSRKVGSYAKLVWRTIALKVSRESFDLSLWDQDAKLIAASQLFDSDWYLEQNLDILPTGSDPLLHYLRWGAKEGCDPNPLFDTSWYLEQNPDVEATGINPLLHYVLNGVYEGRDPNLLFHTRWYLEQNQDVKRAGINPLLHYMRNYMVESSDPNPLFDTSWYLEENPDILAAGKNPLLHYLENGVVEGRDPNSLFDTDWYLEQNPDVAAADINPLQHYLENGAAEGRDPNPLFDTDWYLEENPDVIAAGMNPLQHYLRNGVEEGRDPNPLFDTDWYLEQNPDVVTAGKNPLQHYLESGVAEGRDPNPLFDTDWYLEQNPDARKAGLNPVVHYLRNGAAEGRNPNPLFDTTWYLEQNPDIVAAGMNPLVHYLGSGTSEGRNPNRLFDTTWYLYQNPDVKAAGVNPLLHYLSVGAGEGRDPSPLFNGNWYLEHNPDVVAAGMNPLAHYLLSGAEEGRRIVPSRTNRLLTSSLSANIEPVLLRQASYYTSAGSGFENVDSSIIDGSKQEAKVIAFYLPQFHPIPENDSWWGTGFTEWRNVTRGLPRFIGHHQPRMPRDLGFYDLRTPGIIAQQVDLAKKGGIFGFCFYHYFFNGKKLLHDPLNSFISDPAIKFPFCLMWANENWTRRWDGLDQEILIQQDYDQAYDKLLIEDLARYFQHPQYIRINGRPLFSIYRPGLIPNAAEKIAHWRELFKTMYGEDPYILMTQSFSEVDPHQFGLDGALEFPPHEFVNNKQMLSINNSLSELDSDFSGSVFAYDDLIKCSLKKAKPNYDLIRTVVPSWDNEARRPNRGLTLSGSTPRNYEMWLHQMIGYAKNNPFAGESLVFVNAWNEWAEGAYLEPDVHWGGAYLNATARAVSGQTLLTASELLKPSHIDPNVQRYEALSLPQVSSGQLLSSGLDKQPTAKLKVLICGHDAHRHGAQFTCLNIARYLKKSFGVEITVILLEGGALEADFRDIATTHVIDSDYRLLKQLVFDLRSQGYEWAICNTVVTGNCAEILSKSGFTVVSLVHELATFLQERRLDKECSAIAKYAHKVVFPAEMVRDSFERLVGSLGTRALIQPQGLLNAIIDIDDARASVLKEFNIPSDSLIVLNAAFGDLRKGIDLYLQLARRLQAIDNRFHFIWVGDISNELRVWFERDLKCEPLCHCFHQIPFSTDLSRYYQAADVFALTSREDPFPTVVIEALACGTPVVAFEGGGGYAELLTSSTNGRLVPFVDVEAMANAVYNIALDENMQSAEARLARSRQARARFDFRRYAFNLLKQFDESLNSVSVIVPNYNYAYYLEQRLQSIFDQSYPIYELIVLDDASGDDSLQRLKQIQATSKRQFTILANEKNSGSAFQQWLKGIKLAQGNLIWIAEADDSSSEYFLAQLAERLVDPSVNLAFCDSRQIDQDDRLLAENYGYYYAKVDDVDFSQDLKMDGIAFLNKCLAVRNSILNVSSVVFRKSILLSAMAEIGEEIAALQVAGDWRLYIQICQMPGFIAYIAQPLNTHRRHTNSVTHSLDFQRHIDEVKIMHELVTATADGEIVRPSQNLYRMELEQQFFGAPGR